MEDISKINIIENSEKYQFLFNKNNSKMNSKINEKNNTRDNFFKSLDTKNKTKNFRNNRNKKEKHNIEIKRMRNPGVDFSRIIAMYTIVFHHYLYFGNDFKHFPQHKRKLSFIHGIISRQNNVFTLISGIVLYKTNKYSNLLYLWLTVFFYSVGIHKYVLRFQKGFVLGEQMYKEYYPLIFYRYWYFSIYFGMYLFVPIINKGIASLTKYEFRLVVMSTLFVFVFWKDYKNPDEDLFQLHEGKSVLWFLIFYLTGAYIGKYRVDYEGIKKYIYCFICLVIFYFFSYIYYKAFNNEFYLSLGNSKIKLPLFLKGMLNEKCSSILKVIQSNTLCLFFMQIHYNKYIAKIICFIGPLVFGVFLIHGNELIINNFLMHIFDKVPKDLSFNSLLGFLSLKSLKMFIFCILIDYLRHLLFSLLKFKKILV